MSPFSVLFTGGERERAKARQDAWREAARRAVDRQFAKLELLFQHYEIPLTFNGKPLEAKVRWQALSFKLACDLGVPGFRVLFEEPRQGGRRIEWGGSADLDLVGAVDTIRKARAVTIRAAIEECQRFISEAGQNDPHGFRLKTVESLRIRYHEAKRRLREQQKLKPIFL
jgi:hypothetical protein